MKALGKKKTAQNGTLVAFACDCISVCKSLARRHLSSASPNVWPIPPVQGQGEIPPGA